ncbi:MAG: NfeD family protein [Rhodothermales bacterium]|nr:NfeD family protein [Rhodothermales bacterium]
MLTVYWACLLGGLGFTLLALLFGDALDGVLDGFDLDFDGPGLLDPLSLVGGVAAFGAAGVVLTEAAELAAPLAAGAAAVIGLALAVVMHVAYVRPMKRGENSTGFSVEEYRGKLGEVITAIPARGYGEVLVKMGTANTFRTAASFDETPIARGTAVVVVEVRDGDLLVAPFEEEPAALPQRGAAPPALPA